MGKNRDAAPKDCIPLAKAAATQALEIDPLLSQAHSALADSLAIYDWDWAESERHFKKALELDPNISYTHLVYSASYLYPVGRVGPALAEAEKAVELEPLSLINNSLLVSAYLNARPQQVSVIGTSRLILERGRPRPPERTTMLLKSQLRFYETKSSRCALSAGETRSQY